MLTNLYVRGQMLFDDLKNDQRGVTAIEYAVVAVAVTAMVILVFGDSGSIDTALDNAMTTITTKLSEL